MHRQVTCHSEGEATTGLTTWQRLYQLVCQQLFARDERRFLSLIDHAEFISNRGHHTVTTDAGSLRKPLAVSGDLYMEANLSANSICDVLRRLLLAYVIPVE